MKPENASAGIVGIVSLAALVAVLLLTGCGTIGNGKLDVDALTKLGNIEAQATSLADRVDKGQERAQRACELAQRLRGQADSIVGMVDDPKANAAQAGIVAILDRICARVTPEAPTVPAFKAVTKYYVTAPDGNEIEVTKDTPIQKKTVYEPLPVPQPIVETLDLSQLSVSGGDRTDTTDGTDGTLDEILNEASQ